MCYQPNNNTLSLTFLRARDLLKPKRTGILGLLHNFLSQDLLTDDKSHYSITPCS